jgi:hypothetical protein
MSWYAKKMQHRIVNLNIQNLQVFAKKHAHDEPKKHMIKKN